MTTKALWVLTYALGGFTALLVAAWIQYETTYNSWIDDHKRIYRLTATITPPNGGSIRNATSPEPLHQLIWRDFPHIVDAVAYYRFLHRRMRQQSGADYMELPWLEVSDGFFELFPLTETALEDGSSVILDANAAASFGRLASGSIVEVEGLGPARVQEVVQPFPANSTVAGSAFSLLPPMTSPESSGHWFEFSGFTYIRLKPNQTIDQLLELVAENVDRWIRQEPGAPPASSLLRFEAQRADEVHLAKSLGGEIVRSGDPALVYAGYIALGVLAIVILFNGISLARVSVNERSLEAGLEYFFGMSAWRKILRSIVRVGSMAVAGAALLLILLSISSMTGIDRVISMITPEVMGWFCGCGIMMVVVHVAAVAFFDLGVGDGFSRAENHAEKYLHYSSLAGIFVETMFAAALTLGATGVWVQFLLTAIGDVGFDNQQYFVVKPKGDVSPSEISSLKNALMGRPEISSASSSSTYPLAATTAVGTAYWVDPQEGIPVNLVVADGDLDATLGLRLANGRFLDSNRLADQVQENKGSVVVTESLIRFLPQQSDGGIVGRTLSVLMEEGEKELDVVGVIEDFQIGNNRSQRPSVIYSNPQEKSLVLFDLKNGRSGSDPLGFPVAKLLDEVLGEGRWEGINAGRLWDDFMKTGMERVFLLFGGVLVAGVLLFTSLASAFNNHVGGNISEIGLRMVFGASPLAALFRVTASISASFLLAVAFGLLAGQMLVLPAMQLDAANSPSYLVVAIAMILVLASSMIRTSRKLRLAPLNSLLVSI